MFRRTKKPKKNGEGENPFLLSFSDFMASLLAIFILIVVVEVIQLKQKEDKIEERKDGHWLSNNEYNQLLALKNEVNILINKIAIFDKVQVGINASLNKVGKRRKALEGVITKIQSDLVRQGVAVSADIPSLCLRFNDDTKGENAPKKLLFDPGKSEIQKKYEETVSIIGTSLLKVLSEPENRKLIDTVFIEGHTDSTGKNDEMLNWHLSTERALSIWKFWTVYPGNIKALKDLGNPKPMISVSGYADTRSTFTDEQLARLGPDRPEDRRIEIRFTLASSEKQELNDVQNAWNDVLNWFPAEIERLKAIIHGP